MSCFRVCLECFKSLSESMRMTASSVAEQPDKAVCQQCGKTERVMMLTYRHDIEGRPLPGALRTCRADELERLTSEGWCLREIREEDRVEEGGETDDYSVPGPNSYPNMFRRRYPNVAVRKLVFVLEMARDQVIEDLRAAVVERDARILELVRSVDALKALVSETEKFASEADDAWKQAEKRLGEIVELRAQKNLLESDVSKLRKEIGEARAREILGR